jgi:methionyl-tRNA formyltransferase
MGTPEFAVPCLEAIHNSEHQVAGVVTAPDKLGGRGMKQIISSPVKKYAEENDMKVLQPLNLKSKKFHRQLEKLNADVMVVVAFRMLPEIIWSMPKFGTYNLHASLLPDYRGAAPINRAIMNGDKVTGLTTFRLQQKIDTGAIAYQLEIPIDDKDNAGSLHDKLMNSGPELIMKTINAIADGNIVLHEQSDRPAKEAPKIFFEECRIDWTLDCVRINNFIRGLSPYPGAWTKLDNKTLKVFEADYILTNHDQKPGHIFSVVKEDIEICCGKGLIRLIEIQIEGKSRMNVKNFLNGYKILSDKLG